MHALRHSRRFGRLFAVWLLVWFMSMVAARVPPAAGVASLGAAAAVAATQADHEHHHGQVAEEPDAEAGPTGPQLHSGHASGSPSHCPLCTHGAAPPPPAFASAPGADHAGERPAAPALPAPRVRTDAPPPARGPPLFS